MNVCKNNCSVDSHNLVELLETIKCIYERIIKDVYKYAKELEKFQNYYQKYNLNNDVMLEIMYLKLDKLLSLFYISIYNHLSITTNVKGIGDQIIKPVTQEYGVSTTIKYQNICNSCNKCCDIITQRENLKVQTTINVGTYDNISINKLKEFTNDDFYGYNIIIGKLSYIITNYKSVHNLKKLINVLNTSVEENLYGYKQIEVVTAKSIEILYKFIDKQIETLSDVKLLLSTNVEYLNKYIKKFKLNLKLI